MKFAVFAICVAVVSAQVPPYNSGDPVAPTAPPPVQAPVVLAPTPANLVKDKLGCLWFNTTSQPCNATCGGGFIMKISQYLGVDDPANINNITCQLMDGSNVPAASLTPKEKYDIYYTPCNLEPCTVRCPRCNVTGTELGPEGCIVTGDNTDGTCVCKAGFGGSTCSKVSDLCANAPCGPNGVCRISNDVRICKCVNGYGGDKCDKDLCPDKCTPGNYARCYQDQQGEFYCQCRQGFAGRQCENTTTAVTCPDNCSNGKGTCVNKYGTPACECTGDAYGDKCQFTLSSAQPLSTSCNVDQMSAVLECSIGVTGATPCAIYSGYMNCTKQCKDMEALWYQYPPMNVNAADCLGNYKPDGSTCNPAMYTMCLVEAKKKIHGVTTGAAPFCLSSILLSRCAAQSACYDLLGMYCQKTDASEKCKEADDLKIGYPNDCKQVKMPA